MRKYGALGITNQNKISIHSKSITKYHFYLEKFLKTTVVNNPVISTFFGMFLWFEKSFDTPPVFLKRAMQKEKK